MKTAKQLKKVLLPAEVLIDGKWVVPFTKKQYNAVIDYLVTIGIISE